jgi:hypothetical protein
MICTGLDKIHRHNIEKRNEVSFMRKLTLGLIQMSMSEGMDGNLEHALELIKGASGKGADVICLPDLFITRYFAQ